MRIPTSLAASRVLSRLLPSTRLYSVTHSTLSEMVGKDFPSSDGSEKPAQALPPLSASDLRTYNRMADGMEQFHNHFRLSWRELYAAVEKRSGNLSARQLISGLTNFCRQLDFHHSIEEKHIFPVLAKKMPEFRKELDLLKQHKQIHAGLDNLEAYLEKCRSGEEDLRREEVKRLMDSFGTVLWNHLDEEVETLKADNMRKYWSLEEMRRLPM